MVHNLLKCIQYRFPISCLLKMPKSERVYEVSLYACYFYFLTNVFALHNISMINMCIYTYILHYIFLWYMFLGGYIFPVTSS